jgi:hypothetical protein
MKKLIVVLLLLAIPAMAYDANYFLGKWICKDYNANKEFNVLINKDTFIFTSDNEMDYAKYNIMPNNMIILHYFIDKARTQYSRTESIIIEESKNSFYLRDLNQKYTRVK